MGSFREEREGNKMIININETSRVIIEQDDYPFNPRKEYDNLGTLAAWHGRYGLSDIETDKLDMKYYLKELKANKDIFYPVYMLDHSGLSLSVTPFNCPWDSGLLGFISVSKERIAKEQLTPHQARKLLRGELETFNHYLNGNVWSFAIETWNPNPDCGWEVTDSCGGFIGDLKENGILDHLPEEARLKVLERI